jgi:hypothetical protein
VGKKPEPFRCPHCGGDIQNESIASHLGKISAKKMKKRHGPDYFKKLQAKRKKKSGGTHGGRPPAES